ncbi:hypothetical protein [Rubellimicrobium aerolatum]|uniref:DUF4164 family protein n=1 Tax=Rubellimicrobium aerolatum TaxID=490979 RepID=A0ABW0SDF9_9RHOB|nr:hypothetical protein [Rubellimicrobium aerolatum]MBP1805724.1 putative nuclease with TOPRIM domain [Rubellimicrobium aerolatum]
MTEEPFNLVLEHLKRIQSKLDVLSLDMGELKLRMTEVEGRLGEHTRLFGHLEVGMSALNGRIDRLDERVARIERRLDLIEA